MKIITFIIPSYNVERYLRTALTSFITSDENLNNQIEVVVVDDGSGDGTANIARSYIERYPNMFRLILKENGGHGSTINIGSKVARGKFFKVIDADDWVVTENLSKYISFLQESEAEVVLTPFHMVDMNTGGRTVQKMYITDYSRIYTPNELAASWKSFDRCTTFHGVTYRTDFYNQYRHELPEKVFYEDQEYATIPLCHAEKVAVLDLMIYQYLVGNSQQSVTKENQIKRIEHLENVIEHMLDYWSVHHMKQEFSREYFLRKMEDVILAYYRIMCVVNPNKAVGRKACGRLNHIIEKKVAEIYGSLHKKYILFWLFSILCVNEDSYEKIIHSSAFRFVRRNHGIEKE